MIETQTASAQETSLSGEPLPNEPEWFFSPLLSEEERARLTNDIVAALKTVFDPEIPCDIYELGLIYRVDVDAERLIKIEMTLTAPGCPVAGDLVRQVEGAVASLPGILGADVTMVFDPPWDPGRMSDEARVSLDMF